MIPINKCFLSCVSLYTLSLFHFKRNYTQRQEKIHLLSTLICGRCNSSYNILSSYTALCTAGKLQSCPGTDHPGCSDLTPLNPYRNRHFKCMPIRGVTDIHSGCCPDMLHCCRMRKAVICSCRKGTAGLRLRNHIDLLIAITFCRFLFRISARFRCSQHWAARNTSASLAARYTPSKSACPISGLEKLPIRSPATSLVEHPTTRMLPFFGCAAARSWEAAS